MVLKDMDELLPPPPPKRSQNGDDVLLPPPPKKKQKIVLADGSPPLGSGSNPFPNTKDSTAPLYTPDEKKQVDQKQAKIADEKLTAGLGLNVKSKGLGSSLTGGTGGLTKDFTNKITGTPSAIEQQQNDQLRSANKAFASNKGEYMAEDIQSSVLNKQQDYLNTPDDTGLTFSESVGNTYDNFVTSLKGTLPRLSTVATSSFEKLIGKEFTNTLTGLPRLEFTEDGMEIQTGRTLDDIRNQSMAELDYLETQTKEVEGIVNNARRFDLVGLSAGVVNTVGSLLSTIVPSAASGGSLLFTDMVGGSMHDYNTAKAKHLGVTTEQLFAKGDADFWVPTVIGGAAYGLEKIGLKGIQNAINKELIGSGFKKALLLGHEWNKEGATEWIQIGLDTANMAIAEGGSIEDAVNKAAKAMFSTQGLEAYAAGFIGSVVASGAGRVAKKIFSPKKKAALDDLENKKGKAWQDMANPNVPPAAKEAIAEALVETNLKIDDLQNEDRKEVDNLTEEQKVKVQEVSTKIEEVQQAIADPNVTESTKEILTEQQKVLEKELADNMKAEKPVAGKAEKPADTAEQITKEAKQTFEKVAEAVAGKGVYYFNGEKGELKTDGQTVVFETNSTIQELGNIDELSDVSIDDLGVEKESALDIALNQDNSLDIEGVNYKNNYSDPNAAINYDKDGSVISVNLETNKGEKRTFRGQRAEEIAYQYKLKNFEQNGTEEQIDRAIESADQAISTQSEVKQTAAKTKVDNTNRYKVKPKNTALPTTLDKRAQALPKEEQPNVLIPVKQEKPVETAVETETPAEVAEPVKQEPEPTELPDVDLDGMLSEMEADKAVVETSVKKVVKVSQTVPDLDKNSPKVQQKSPKAEKPTEPVKAATEPNTEPDTSKPIFQRPVNQRGEISDFAPNERLIFGQGNDADQAVIGVNPIIKKNYSKFSELSEAIKKIARTAEETSDSVVQNKKGYNAKQDEGSKFVDLRHMSEIEIIAYAETINENKVRNKRYGGIRAKGVIATESYGRGKKEFDGIVINQNSQGITIVTDNGETKTSKNFVTYKPEPTKDDVPFPEDTPAKEQTKVKEAPEITYTEKLKIEADVKKKAKELAGQYNATDAVLKDQKLDMLSQLEEVEDALWQELPKADRSEGITHLGEAEQVERIRSLGYEVSDKGVITFEVKDDGTFKTPIDMLSETRKAVKAGFPEKTQRPPTLPSLNGGKQLTPNQQAEARGSLEASQTRLDNAKENLATAMKSSNTKLQEVFKKELEREQAIFEKAQVLYPVKSKETVAEVEVQTEPEVKPTFSLYDQFPMKKGKAILTLEKMIRSDGKVMPIYEWIESFPKNSEVREGVQFSSKRSEKGYTLGNTVNNKVLKTVTELDYFKYLADGGVPYSGFVAEQKVKAEADKKIADQKREEQRIIDDEVNKKRLIEVKKAKDKQIKTLIEKGKSPVLETATKGFKSEIESLEKKKQTKDVVEEIERLNRYIDQAKRQVDSTYRIATQLYEVNDQGDVVKKFDWKIGDTVLYPAQGKDFKPFMAETTIVATRDNADGETVFQVEKKEGIINAWSSYDGIFPAKTLADKAIDFLEKSKIKPGGQAFGLIIPIPPAIWNAGMDGMINAIKAGQNIYKAIEAGAKAIKAKKGTQAQADEFTRVNTEKYAEKFAKVNEKPVRVSETTGIRNASVAEQREAYNIPQSDRTPDTDRSHEALDAEAERLISKGYDFSELLGRMRRGDTLSDLEVRINLLYLASLSARMDANPSQENLKAYKEHSDLTEKDGSETARSLAARKGSVVKQDNLANFLIDEMVVMDVAQLDPADLKKRIEEYKRDEDVRAQLEEKLKKTRNALAYQKAQNALNGVKGSTRGQTGSTSGKTAKTSTDFQEDRKPVFDRIKEKWAKASRGGGIMNSSFIPYAPQLIEIAPDVALLVKSYVEEGIVNLDEIVKKLHASLKSEVDNRITESDVLDLIAGEYHPDPKTKTQLSQDIDNLKTQAKLLSQIEDLENGIIPAKVSAQKQRNDLLDSLRSRVRELEKGFKPDQAERSLKAKRDRLTKKIAELREDLRTGNYLKEAVKQPKVKPDAETQKLIDEHIAFVKETQLRRQRAEYAARSKWKKAWDLIFQGLGVRRLVQSALDWSIPFRQAAPVTMNPRHLAITGQAFANMARATFSPKYYDRMNFRIHTHEGYERMLEAGIHFNEISSLDDRQRNEDFKNSFMYKLPFGLSQPLLASNRAADAYLNTCRLELFLKTERALQRQGLTLDNAPKEYEAAAKWAMNVTGRGNMLKFMENGQAQTILGNTFFGARLMASRFNLLNPVYYFRMPKAVREEVMLDLAAYVGTIGLTALACIAAGATVSFDWDEPEFLQVKFGDRVFDLTGGKAQYLRMYFRFMNAMSNVSQKIVKPDSMSDSEYKKYGAFALRSGLNFFRYKLSPNTSYAVSGISGTDAMYQPFDKMEIFEIYPMYVDDVREAWVEQGLTGATLVFVPNFLGIGTRKYGDDRNKESLATSDMTPEQRKQVEAMKEQVKKQMNSPQMKRQIGESKKQMEKMKEQINR